MCAIAVGIEPCTIVWVGRTLLRPFGQDVFFTQDTSDGKMPRTDLIVCDSMLSLLTSTNDRWIRLRAVMTESHLFLSKSTDLESALHGIPLHEILSMSKTRINVPDEDDAGSPQTVTEIAPNQKQPSTLENNNTSNVQADLLIQTIPKGINFGRNYILRFWSEVFHL
jgi:hypothetical protein